MHLARGEEVGRRVVVLDLAQLDALERQARFLPPFAAVLEARAAAVRHKEIRPRAERHAVLFGARAHDGNVQQRGEGAVSAREIDDERAIARAHRGNVSKARAVACALLRAAERCEHVACRQAAAVGKARILAQIEGEGRAVVVVLIAAAQNILRRERLVQRKKSLVEQCAHRLLHPVRAGDGVKRYILKIGQGKGCDGRERIVGALLRFAGGRRLPEILFLLRLVRAPAARKRQKQRERAEKKQNAAHHRASPVRQMTPAMPPRLSPIARCDQ